MNRRDHSFIVQKGRGASPAHAFTLLELLVAMSVLSLLLVLLLSMVSGATRLWKSNENRVDSYREARAALNLISNDLSALYPSAKQTYFYTQDDNLPATPVKAKDMNGSIFFLTAMPAGAQNDNHKSDLCTVGYFLGFDRTSLTGKGTPSYNLYRYFRSSDDTFTALEAGDLLSGVTLDTSPTAPITANCEVLAKNITRFTVVPYTIPSATPAPGGGDVKPASPQKFQKKLETPLPDMLEITITAISNDSAKRFGSSEDAWKDPNSTTRKENDRTFVTRIYVNAAAQVRPPASPSPTPLPPTQ